MAKPWRSTKRTTRSMTANDNATQLNQRHCRRDLHLPRDIEELQADMPSTCKFRIPNANELFKQELVISPPKESMWHGGKFKFIIEVPKEYVYAPPKVRCETRIYHPNISETGEICLSILRVGIDETGWMPTRSLKDVICGLNSLFTDLLNFDDPLNSSAADHFIRDPNGFTNQVQEYIDKYCHK